MEIPYCLVILCCVAVALTCVLIDTFICNCLVNGRLVLSITPIGTCRIIPAKPLAVPLGPTEVNAMLAVGVTSLMWLCNILLLRSLMSIRIVRFGRILASRALRKPVIIHVRVNGIMVRTPSFGAIHVLICVVCLLITLLRGVATCAQDSLKSVTLSVVRECPSLFLVVLCRVAKTLIRPCLVVNIVAVPVSCVSVRLTCACVRRVPRMAFVLMLVKRPQ